MNQIDQHSGHNPRERQPPVDITAIVLTWNESRNVRRCLESVVSWCPIMVVDSGSVDETEAICREYTDAFYVHPYMNHAAQWQWALEHLPVATTWVLALDADFTVSASLRRQLEAELESLPKEVDGVYVRHRYVFGGGTIRFGGTKHDWLRIIRLGHAHADQSDMVDFRFQVDGNTVTWPGLIEEYNFEDEDISTWLIKQDKFSLRLAVEEELRRGKRLDWSGRPRFFGTPDQRTMWLRDHWMRLPLFWRPVIYYFYRYIIRLGFLDGRAGFLYHTLQGFWLRLVVDWKTWQLRRLGVQDEVLEHFCARMLQSRTGSVTEIASGLSGTDKAMSEGWKCGTEESG